MKSSQILRDAARLVESGEVLFSCHAVALAAGLCDCNETDSAAHKAYSTLLGRLPTVPDIWRGAEAYEHRAGSQFGTNTRVMALCLAAAIAESEGD